LDFVGETERIAAKEVKGESVRAVKDNNGGEEANHN